MAPKKNTAAAAACVVLLLSAGAAEAQAQAQGRECVPQLNRLLACRACLVPGAADLGAISRGCACTTMATISSLPSRCNLAQVNCSARG